MFCYSFRSQNSRNGFNRLKYVHNHARVNSSFPTRKGNKISPEYPAFDQPWVMSQWLLVRRKERQIDIYRSRTPKESLTTVDSCRAFDTPVVVVVVVIIGVVVVIIVIIIVIAKYPFNQPPVIVVVVVVVIVVIIVVVVAENSFNVWFAFLFGWYHFDSKSH